MTSQTNGPTSGSPPPPASSRPSQDLSYMHRPPRILPNYGKKHGSGAKLKTNVPRVLLYDNVTQQTILDFQLSGLQSQQYKTYREMEMHMNSFSLRSKAREKSLKNITKVPHWSDYDAFMEEFQHQSMTDFKNRRSLPRVNNSRMNMISSSPTRRKKRRTAKKRHSDPSVSQETPSNAMNDKSKSAENSSHQFHLPHIEIQSPVTLVSANSQVEQNGKNSNFDPKRPVGFKMEKSAQGLTRIFHTLPVTDEPGQPDNEMAKLPVETDDVKEGKETDVVEEGKEPEVVQETKPSDAIEAIEEANLPENNEKLPEESEKPDGKPTTVPQVVVEPAKELEINIEEPSLDYRFGKLERVLIPQDPPNDGFIELSPSFEKKYPDTAFVSQYKRSVIRKELNVADHGEAKSELSEHSHDSDDDDEEEKEEHGDNPEDNDALGRLGNF